MRRGELRRCPECGQAYPHDDEHALRRLAWLHDLPRFVSPSNNDVLIHDGYHGRDRFLLFEIKSPHEAWPPQAGQRVLLEALAKLANWTVRILRGRVDAIELYRVTPTGIEVSPIHTDGGSIRSAVSMWIDGGLWRDAEARLGMGVPQPPQRIATSRCRAELDGDQCLKPANHEWGHESKGFVWPRESPAA